MHFSAINAFQMGSGANKSKDEIVKSGFAKSIAYKTITTACKEPHLIGMLMYILAIILNEF